MAQRNSSGFDAFAWAVQFVHTARRHVDPFTGPG